MDVMVKCRLCQKRAHFIEQHLSQEHPEITLDDYKKRFPSAKLMSKAAAEKLEPLKKVRDSQAAPNGQVINYVRVSSIDQNEDRQLDALPKADEIFRDKVPGSTTKRPALQDMLRFIRKGDHVNVASIDRLARNIEDLHRIVAQIKEKGATVTFHKESLTYGNGENSAMSDLLFNIQRNTRFNCQ